MTIRMEYRRLRFFIAVVEELHLTRAASRHRLVGASAALRDDPERLARLVGIVEAAPAR
jgi:hypothetical protein